MKKYYPIDFDEKGKAILGEARNTPTSNGFIPTTWTPPAPVSEGSGLLSISISPELETDPALDSVSPIYYDDLTDEEKEQGKEIEVSTVNGLQTGELTFTITPTPDWYALNMSTYEFGDMGEPVTTTVEVDSSLELLQIGASACNSNTLDPQPTEFVGVNLIIHNNGGQ